MREWKMGLYFDSWLHHIDAQNRQAEIFLAPGALGKAYRPGSVRPTVNDNDLSLLQKLNADQSRELQQLRKELEAMRKANSPTADVMQEVDELREQLQQAREVVQALQKERQKWIGGNDSTEVLQIRNISPSRGFDATIDREAQFKSERDAGGGVGTRSTSQWANRVGVDLNWADRRGPATLKGKQSALDNERNRGHGAATKATHKWAAVSDVNLHRIPQSGKQSHPHPLEKVMLKRAEDSWGSSFEKCA